MKVNAMAKRTTRVTTPRTSQHSGTYPSEPTSIAGRASDGGGRDIRSNSSEPTEEEIRIRAYGRYLERGGGDGRDFDDWLQAERELKIHR